VVDCSVASLILRVTGASEKLDSFITLLRPFGMVELVRSGKILMTRGPDPT
jgi:acetolactate synthase-1/3 small subunit